MHDLIYLLLKLLKIVNRNEIISGLVVYPAAKRGDNYTSKSHHSRSDMENHRSNEPDGDDASQGYEESSTRSSEIVQNMISS